MRRDWEHGPVADRSCHHRDDNLRQVGCVSACLESEFIVPLAAGKAQVERIGPKAANLAALAQAGLPTPGGFCLTAEAYRRQIAYLKLADSVGDYRGADMAAQRRL